MAILANTKHFELVNKLVEWPADVEEEKLGKERPRRRPRQK